MTRHENDPINDAIDHVSSSNTLKRIVFIVAFICLASSLVGLFLPCYPSDRAARFFLEVQDGLA